MSLPKAVLFDMDDTLLSFDTLADEVWRDVPNAFAHRLRGLQPQLLFGAIMEFRDWYWSDPERHRRGRLDMEVARREVVGSAMAKLGLDDPSLRDRIAAAFARQRDERIELAPGALTVLSSLRDLGVRLALVTNGGVRGQRAKIDRFGLAGFFDCIVVEGEFGFGKPDERVFKYTLGQLGAAASDAWMVGDDLERDIAGAQLGHLRRMDRSERRTSAESDAVRPDRLYRISPSCYPCRPDSE